MCTTLMENLSALIRQIKNDEAQASLRNVDLRNLVDNKGRTLLHVAVEAGNEIMVKYLLQMGLDVDSQDKYGQTALILATRKRHHEIINILLQFNPNLHVKGPSKKTVLKEILTFDLISAERLVDVAKINKILQLECQGDKEKIAMKLMYDDNCSITVAVCLQNAEVLRIMLSNKGRGMLFEYDNDTDCRTPLHIAFKLHNLKCAMVLLEHKADVNATCSLKCIPFSYYIQFDDSDLELEVLKIILERATSLTMSDCAGEMQLSVLLKKGKKRALQLLFQSDINLNAKDETDRTSLHYLAMNSTLSDHEDLIDMLRDKNLDVNVLDIYGRNAFYYAARCGSYALLQFLFNHNVDVQIADFDYLTPLHALCNDLNINEKKCNKNYYNCAKFLLQHGTDPQADTCSGKTVFDYILQKKYFNLTKLILTHLTIQEVRGEPIIQLIRHQINSHPWLTYQYNLSKLQLARLKKIRIPEFTTLFEFLCDNEKNMELYLRNEEFFSVLKRIGDKLINKSEFFNICWSYFEKSLRKVQLRKNAAEFVCEIMGFSYYRDCVIVDKVLEYFTDNDFEYYA